MEVKLSCQNVCFFFLSFISYEEDTVAINLVLFDIYFH